MTAGASRVVMLAVGTRGDVQPFLALGCALAKTGYAVTIATHGIFETAVRQAGLEFAAVAGNPQEFMQGKAGEAYLTSGRNTFRLASSMAAMFRPIKEQLLDDLLSACRGADAIVVSSLSREGVDIAHHLGVPCVVAALGPSTPTGAFPHRVAPALPLGSLYNRLTYVGAPLLLGLPLAGIVSRWRKRALGMDKSAPRGDVQTLYGFSSELLAAPPDWPASAHITGYWFLEEESFEPPDDLRAFLDAGPPPVCLTFSSINGAHGQADAMGRTLVRALRGRGERVLLLTGWGGLAAASDDSGMYVAEALPHTWLLPRVRAVVHHGGAGTSAAAAQAGVPSLVMPFCADQFFWADVLARRGVAPAAVRPAQIESRLGPALDELLGAPMAERARALGERVRKEDGARVAAEIIRSTWSRHRPARTT